MSPIHRIAITQMRCHDDAIAYLERRTTQDHKTKTEALRGLKRRLSDIVYRTMLDDIVTTSGTGPGGHRGASLISSAAGSQPHTDTSDQSLPGPVTHHHKTPA